MGYLHVPVVQCCTSCRLLRAAYQWTAGHLPESNGACARQLVREHLVLVLRSWHGVPAICIVVSCAGRRSRRHGAWRRVPAATHCTLLHRRKRRDQLGSPGNGRPRAPAGAIFRVRRGRSQRLWQVATLERERRRAEGVTRPVWRLPAVRWRRLVEAAGVDVATNAHGLALLAQARPAKLRHVAACGWNGTACGQVAAVPWRTGELAEHGVRWPARWRRNWLQLCLR
jgi:hypothetical protein